MHVNKDPHVNKSHARRYFVDNKQVRRYLWLPEPPDVFEEEDLGAHSLVDRRVANLDNQKLHCE